MNDPAQNRNSKAQPQPYPSTTIILTIPNRFLAWIQGVVEDLNEKEADIVRKRPAGTAPATVHRLPAPKRRKQIPRPILDEPAEHWGDPDIE